MPDVESRGPSKVAAAPRSPQISGQTAVAPATHTDAVTATQPGGAGKRRWWLWIAGGTVAVLVAVEGIPWLVTAFTTVSTNDAYVNGHVTFVAPRVPGQVARVLVDENNRVHVGDLLVQLDKEPYQVQVDIAQASADAAEADLVAARAQALAIEGRMRSLRFNLEHAIEHVNDQVAELRSKVAGLDSERAELIKAQDDYDRASRLNKVGASSTESVEHTQQ